MSVESAKAFLEKFGKDEGFRAQVEGAANDEDRRALVKAAGYEFTAEEMKTALGDKEMKAAVGHELSEEELAGVSGGGAAEWVGAGAGVVAAIVAAA